MSDTPLVSIVIPVHNAEKYIGKTIESVKAQTYANWEIILVDDCSTDDSVKVIEPYLEDKRINLIKNEVNLKAAKSRNKGIEEANGQLLAFLDADDIWDKDKLKEELNFLRKKNCAFAYTSYEFGDEQAVGTGKYVRILPVLDYKKALSRTIIFTSTVMFDLDRISKEEIKMPDVPSEDTATWWKILKKGYKAYGLDEVLTTYRRPEKSLSSNKLIAIKRIWFLYRNVEKLGLFTSVWNFVFWAFRATFRRL